jgi:hypothetical protein
MPMNARGWAVLAGLAGLIASCTPMEWQHASLGSMPSEADVGECNQLAFHEAQRRAFFHDFGWPRRSWGPQWGPWPPFSTSDRFFLERDLFDFCMRARGYRLVPASSG